VPRPRDPSPTLIVVVLGAGVLSYAMLQSLVVPALGSIQRELGTSATATAWLFTSFLLSTAIATPILGRLGDMFGRTHMVFVCLGALAVGTVVAALTSTFEVLLAARVLQGLAGALLPLAFGIISDVYPPTRVAAAIGGISAVLAVGSATGIVLSGTIVEHLGYRWLFWLPLAPIAATSVAAFVLMPRTGGLPDRRVDWPGALLLTGWLVALLVGVSQGRSWGWTSAAVLGLFVGAVLLLVAWWVVELRTAVPLIDVRLLGQATPSRLNVVGFTSGFAINGAFAWVPQFVQVPESTGYGLGASPSDAGLFILPWSLGSIFAGVVAGRLAARHGSHASLVGGAALSAVALALLSTWHGEAWHVCVEMGLLGIGLGVLTAAMPTMLVAAVPADQRGASTGMNTNIRTIGGAIGAQVLAAIVVAGTTDGVTRESSYVGAFLLLAVMCVLALAAALAVPRHRKPRAGAVVVSSLLAPAPSAHGAPGASVSRACGR
jgi:MFS family permease